VDHLGRALRHTEIAVARRSDEHRPNISSTADREYQLTVTPV
jgi:hypothetical protein